MIAILNGSKVKIIKSDGTEYVIHCMSYERARILAEDINGRI